jgi:hypothetical protein
MQHLILLCQAMMLLIMKTNEKKYVDNVGKC